MLVGKNTFVGVDRKTIQLKSNYSWL